MSTIKHSLGKYNVVPNIDFSNNINMSIPSETKVSAPTIEVDYGFTPFKASDKNSNSNINEFFVENKRESIFSENDIELISEYPVFDFSNKFLITKSKTDLLIINIKRAFYRIYYEQLLNEIDNKKNLSQKLLYPIEIGFSSSDIITIKSVKNILNEEI